MEGKRLRVAIAHGDTNGIGYETIFKTFAATEMLEMCTPVIYGSPKIAAYHRNALGIQANFSIISKVQDTLEGRLNLLTCFENDVKVDLGTPTKESEESGYKALVRAAADLQAGLIDAVVMAPLEPAADSLHEPQVAFFAKQLNNSSSTLPILICERIRVATVTDRMPLADVAKNISKEVIVTKAKVLHNSLKRDFRISNPRIAVLALNPKGKGKEEEESIKPAVKELAEQSIQAFGPYAPEDFFGSGAYTEFDAVLAMYYDQGIIPFKTLTSDSNFIFVAGLPVVCCMPSTDPQYQHAGKGIADELPLRLSIYMAIDAFRNRKNYDEPLANPLPKLYKERRDESEKVRFSIPKKHENNVVETEKEE